MAKAKSTKAQTTKATKKTTAPASTTTRAFEHGRAAAGAKYVKEGFGLTPDDDLAWALGWPHAITLVEDDDDSDAALQAVISDLGNRSVSSALAPRLARLLMNGIYSDPAGKGVYLTYQGKDFAARGPLTADEVRTTLTEQLKGHMKSHGHSVIPLLLEALIGPAALADVLVDAMIALDDKQLIAHDHDKADLADHVPFLLLRVEPADAKKLRERIARRLKSVDTNDVNYTSVVRALGFAVDPKTAPRASETEAHDAMLLVIADDPELVVRAVTESYSEKDRSADMFARYLFTGGAPILALYSEVCPKHAAWPLAKVARGLARMANPEAHALLLELATVSKAKTAAAKCFVERGELLRPFLERAAKARTPSAKTAAAILKKFV